MTYKRRKRDAYWTPAAPVKTLISHTAIPAIVWDPAAGGGTLSRPLERDGRKVFRSDIKKYPGCRLELVSDFLKIERPLHPSIRGIVSNPPYIHSLCEDFILRAIWLMTVPGSKIEMVAMLLRSDYSHAPTFRHLFERHYAARLDLTERIRWIAGTTERPRHNHSWFIWRRDHKGPAEHIIQRRAA